MDAFNDADADGICGDVDNCLEISNPLQENDDTDTYGNACDNCAFVSNPSQFDVDIDGHGDACDNCPATPNVSQADLDGDLEGDRCDLNDGLIYIDFQAKNLVAWQTETGPSSWNAYRGNLALLKSSGVYTQNPATDPNAEAWCGLVGSPQADPELPVPGETVFYLVTSVEMGLESGLGNDSDLNPRPNTHPCP